MDATKVKIALVSCFALLVLSFFSGWWINGILWENKFLERENVLLVDLVEVNKKVKEVEDERTKKLEEQRQQHETTVASINAELADSRSVAERLRKQVRAISQRTSENTAVAGSRETTDPATGVLAELFVKLDERAEVLAKLADRSRASGLACEAAYDAMVETQVQLE